MFFALALLNIFYVSQYAYKKIKLHRCESIYLAQNKLFRKILKAKAEKVKMLKKNLPDIYFIILDAYASSDTLYNHYHIDNRWFINSLKNRGFFVKDDARSNYMRTRPSLCSSLNMQYLPDYVEHFPCEVMWDDNNVQYFLKNLGYKYFNLSQTYNDISLFDGTTYDEIKKDRESIWGEFKTFLFGELYFGNNFIQGLTPIYYHVGKINKKIQWESVIKMSELIKKYSAEQSPKFVHAHFLCPHPPPVFDESGGQFPEQTKSESFIEWRLRGVKNDVSHISKIMLSVIDTILKNSQSPPIIILQADHGSVAYEKFKILSAYYLPEKSVSLIKNTSPVNNFRLVFNNYLGTDFQILENFVMAQPKEVRFLKHIKPYTKKYGLNLIKNGFYTKIPMNKIT
jgi:hypothetical protein